jgi:arylsulfatase A-like enzyme
VLRVIAAALLASLLASSCTKIDSEASATRAVRPSILLVTLDTTCADAIGSEALGIETPAFNELAAKGRRFRQAYATAPQTLPSHSSMMTGLYPAAHGIHENARYQPDGQSLLAERLRKAGMEAH